MKKLIRLVDWLIGRYMHEPMTYPYVVRYFVSSFGFSEIYAIAPFIFSTKHPRADHTFVCNANDAIEAHVKTISHFLVLEKFGGNFARVSVNEWDRYL